MLQTVKVDLQKNMPMPLCGSASLGSSTGVLRVDLLVSLVDAGFQEAETLSTIRATSCLPPAVACKLCNVVFRWLG